MTAIDEERRAIRDAMTRILDGKPIRSDGKLTIKSLAAEADVKRWALTHKHQDLQTEFRDRVAQNGSDPEPVRLLKQHVEKLTQKNQDLRTELREAKAACSMLERLIAVEALEAQAVVRPVRPSERARLHTV